MLVYGFMLIDSKLEKIRLEKKHEQMKLQLHRVGRKRKSMERKKTLTRKLLAIGKEGETKMLEILKQIIYWPCKDGIFYWELYDEEKQKQEYTFGKNCNKELNQKLQDMVYVKIKCLTKL